MNGSGSPQAVGVSSGAPAFGERPFRHAAICFMLLLAPSAPSTHVKWFEAYEIAAKPVPIAVTLALSNFWLAIALALVVPEQLGEIARMGVMARSHSGPRPARALP